MTKILSQSEVAAIREKYDSLVVGELCDTIDALRAKLEVAKAALERCADTENDGCIGPWNDVAINALAQLKEPQ